MISPKNVSLSFHLEFEASSTCQTQAKQTPNGGQRGRRDLDNPILAITIDVAVHGLTKRTRKP